MKPARLILLIVALVAGGLAAFFALSGGSDSEPVQTAQSVEPVSSKVLVANQTIGIGTRLTPDMLSWQDWPENGLRPEFITDADAPDAPEQLNEAVARFEIFVGEPVRFAKLVRADSGYLSAVIAPGMRAVSITVDPESGAGGFIVPNDHVDVIVNRQAEAITFSETILSNVRVIAMGERIGEVGENGEEGQAEAVYGDEVVATLELTPAQAELLVGARNTGDFSLALRSVVDFVRKPGDDGGTNSSVQMIRGGNVTVERVNANSPQQGASVQPVAFSQPLNANSSATGQVPSLEQE